MIAIMHGPDSKMKINGAFVAAASCDITTDKTLYRAVGSLMVRASDSRPEGLGSMLDVTKYPPSAHGFTCRNCGGGDRGRVAIYRPFGEVSLSLNRTVTCMVLKANDRRTSCPCHDEFRGPRSDYVRQVRYTWRQFCYGDANTYLLMCVTEQQSPIGEVQEILDDNLVALHFKYDFWHITATAGSDVVQSGRPIFDDFFQHLWSYVGNNTANVVFQIVKRLWLIRIEQ
ncbi:uncharacterized protein TNCV_3865801 [Trichonephila clavipes]|nr:uncharacterized protein TNCV_3865801 [Trichonephila clavipes]